MNWVGSIIFCLGGFVLFLMGPTFLNRLHHSYECWVSLCRSYPNCVRHVGEFFLLVTIVGLVVWMFKRNLTERNRIENDEAAKRRDRREIMNQLDRGGSYPSVEDVLGRQSFAEFVARLIEQMDTTNSRCIGLYGKWGEGKTFVWQMIRSLMVRESSEVVFVKFCPWQVGKKSEWGALLLSQIADVLNRYGCRNGNLSMRSYARSLGLRPEAGLFSGVPWIGSWIENRIGDLFDSIKLHDQAVKALRSFGGRIIVVVEDLDRLEQDDVCEIIRILKTNGDLPHVLYVLLADEGHLVQALGTRFGGVMEGRAYLEKIVAYPCPLPAVSSMDLAHQYTVRVEGYLAERFSTHLSSEDKEKLSLLSGMFLCIRDVVRAYDQFVMDCEFHVVKGRSGGISVDVVDLAGLSTVKALENGLYGILRNVYHELLSVRGGEKAHKAYDEVWMETKILGCVSPKRKGAIRAFLKWYMGIDEIRSGNLNGVSASYYGLTIPKSEVALANHSLTSAFCVDDYFTTQYCSTSVPSGDQQEFLSLACSNVERAVQKAEEIAKFGRLPFLVQILPEFKAPSEKEPLVCYLTTLMRMADVAWPRDQLRVAYELEGSSYGDVYQKLNIAVGHALLAKERTIKMPLIPEYQAALIASHGFVVGLLMLHEWWHDDSGYSFYTNGNLLDDGFATVINTTLRNVARAAEDGTLFVHPHGSAMLEQWARLICHGNDRDARQAFQKHYGQISELIPAIPAWVLQSCSKPSCFNGVQKNCYTMDVDRFTGTLGAVWSDKALEQLRKLHDDRQLDSRDDALLKCLEFALKQKMMGLPYGQEAQIKVVYGISKE